MGIAAGASHRLGLKADGSIVAWANNGHHECNIPAPNSGLVGVVGSRYQRLALEAFYGDLNCDGVIDFDDVNPFVQALDDSAS